MRIKFECFYVKSHKREASKRLTLKERKILRSKIFTYKGFRLKITDLTLKQKYTLES